MDIFGSSLFRLHNITAYEKPFSSHCSLFPEGHWLPGSRLDPSNFLAFRTFYNRALLYLVSTIFSEFLLYWLSCLESSCFSLGPDHRNKTNWPKVNFSLLSGTWNQNSQWLLCFRTFAFAIVLLGMLFPQILSGYLFFQVSAPQHPRSPYHKWHVPALLHLCLLLSFILLYFLFNIYHDLTQPIYKIALFYFLPFPTRMWAPWE